MKFDYFFDVSTGWSDASEYAHEAIGLNDKSLSVSCGLERLGYRLDKTITFNTVEVEIETFSRICDDNEYIYALHINDQKDISVVFIRNGISLRACVAELIANINVISTLK